MIGGKYLIHQVVGGENLILLAQQYETSVDAIIQCTYKLYIPITVNALLVIPVGNPDLTDLPTFEPVMVNLASDVEAFSELVEGDAVLIQKYNALDDGTILQPGEWILVPR